MFVGLMLGQVCTLGVRGEDSDCTVAAPLILPKVSSMGFCATDPADDDLGHFLIETSTPNR